VTQQWFSGQDWTFYTGRVHAGLPHVIAAAMIIFVWLINIFGVRPAVWVGYVTGALLMIPLFVLIVLPYLTGSWDSSNMQFLIDDAAQPWKLALVWLFLMCWSAYGIEICASFAPEYHDTKRDTALALRSAAMFSLGVYILLPLGAGGVLPTADIAANPLTFYVQEFDKILGVGAGVVIALLCVSLFLSMNSATADGGRALYGIARDDMTVKQLFHLNRYHVPARAMTVDLVVNLFLVFYVTSTLAILYISNIGYVAAHIFAVTGFLLLRRDRPAWPRAIRVSRIWIPIAVLIAAFNTLLLIVGITNPELTYAATWTDVAIGFGILGAAILLFLYRRIVQDKERPHWREETPTMPDAHQAKLLEQELTSA
jgi:amino acid transporter